MPISATGKRSRIGSRNAQSGLTLLELVVVVAIIALLALPVMLRFGGGGAFGGAAPAARSAAALQADLAALRDRALLGRETLVLQPSNDGWSAEGLRTGQQAGRRNGARTAMQLDWRIDAAPPAGERPQGEGLPPIRFLPDGRATPFTLRITGADQPGLECRFDGWEAPECRPL